MTIRHLKIFISVCEEMNMSSSAKKMFMTQPAVSQTIKELEEHYQTLLFQRFPTCLYITEEGKSLFHYAKQIVNLMEETEKKIREPEEKVILRVGANITVGDTMLCNYLKTFKELFPTQGISIYINNGKNIKEKLMSNKLDLALMEEVKAESFFISETFFEDRVVFVVHPGHKLANKKKLKLEELSGEDFLVRERGAGVRETLESILQIKGVSVVMAWESGSSQAVIQGVLHGFGIGVLPYRLAKNYLEEGKLIELKMVDCNLNRRLQIVRHKNKWMNKAAEDFIEVVRTYPIEGEGE